MELSYDLPSKKGKKERKNTKINSGIKMRILRFCNPPPHRPTDASSLNYIFCWCFRNSRTLLSLIRFFLFLGTSVIIRPLCSSVICIKKLVCPEINFVKRYLEQNANSRKLNDFVSSFITDSGLQAATIKLTEWRILFLPSNPEHQTRTEFVRS